MIIGVPREIHRHEHRVALSPSAVARLVRHGHRVVVESDAGSGAHFTNRDYEQAGAQIVYTGEEAHKRADLVCRISRLADEEIDLLKPGSTVCAFHHLAVWPRQRVERLMALGVTLIGYEVVRDTAGDLPVLVPFSEMAGMMAMQIAAHYLQTEAGGRGIVLGNVPGVPPPTVLILGAGVVGTHAARQALATGAHVIVVDADLAKLRRLGAQLSVPVVTDLPRHTRLMRYASFADVVIGAVLVPGSRTPFVFTEEMVRSMKAGTVVIDLSIDQGGCVETSRPTTLDNPTFKVHGVVHYCVPNLTASVPRTASRAMSHTSLPYILALAEKGLDRALSDDPGLAQGVYIYRGSLVHPQVAANLELDPTPLASCLEDTLAQPRQGGGAVS